MPPRTSFCLNIPKTGSTYTRHFFAAADCLELQRRWCRRTRHRMPSRASIGIVTRIKQYGLEYGNLNCRSPRHHAGYDSLPHDLRHHRKLCALRSIKTWYCSFYLYHTRSMRNAMLLRAIRLLVYGEESVLDERARAIMLGQREAFVRKFMREGASARSTENISVEFFLWFIEAIRNPIMMHRDVGPDTSSNEIGFLTFRAITILFEDPWPILGMDADRFDAYFASGQYLHDLRCDFYLDFDRLTDQLCSLMTDELGYSREIVLFLRDRVGRINVSPDRERTRAMRALGANRRFERIREKERIYEKYLLPLAGSHLGSGTG